MHRRIYVGETTTEDAKCFPHMHPYGTGSLGSEFNSGGANGLLRLCRNRLLLIQPCFRNSAMWAFWNMQRNITGKLFGENFFRRKLKLKPAPAVADNDNFGKIFGTVMPSTGLMVEEHVCMMCRGAYSGYVVPTLLPILAQLRLYR